MAGSGSESNGARASDAFASGLVIGIDTGGTFTDVTVLAPSGELLLNKAPTTPADFSQGVVDALGEVADSMGTSVEGVLRAAAVLKHGTTVGTNALITRRGPKVGFLTTRGVEDTPLIMRAVGRVDGLPERERKHMAWVQKPAPLTPKDRVRGVRERINYAGEVVVPLNDEDVREALRYLIEERQVEAIAVSLLFAWVNPVHERRIQAIANELYGDRDVRWTFSHELVPVVREYARGNTVIIDAFLGPTMDRYLNRLDSRLRDSGFGGRMMVMQANGGLSGVTETSAIGTLSSGPAGGVIGSKFLADLLGHEDIVTTDMGGTSFDVALITGGQVHYQRDPLADRFRVIQPMVAVESIGAGGGTIAHVDDVTGRVLLGPDSAGADPGPACYGSGGERPTITDADLLLGYLDPEYFWGGRRKLDLDRAEKAVREHVADPLGMDVVEAAAGIYRLINNQMSNLIRKRIGQAGSSPEHFVLYAFGGAGPVHCAAYAAQLGIEKAFIFGASPVLSSFGVATSDIIHSQMVSFYTDLPGEPDALNQRVESVQEALAEAMEREGVDTETLRFVVKFHMRYRRQLNELEMVVPGPPYTESAQTEIVARFHSHYEEIYGPGSGYAAAGVELVSINVDAIAPTSKPSLAEAAEVKAAPEPKGERPTWSVGDADFVDTPIFDFAALAPGHRIKGPAVIEAEIGNVVIPAGTHADVNRYQHIVLDLGAGDGPRQSAGGPR